MAVAMSLRARQLEGRSPEGASEPVAGDESAASVWPAAPSGGRRPSEPLAGFQGEPRRRSGCDNDDLGGDANEARHLNCEARWQRANSNCSPEASAAASSSSSSAAAATAAAAASTEALHQRRRASETPRVCRATQAKSSESNQRVAEQWRPPRGRRGERREEEPERERAANLKLAAPAEEDEREFHLRRARKSQRRRQRERSASITSDYFSSTHESPVLLGARAKHQQQHQQQQAQGEQPETKQSATIYENPLFARNEQPKEEEESVRRMKTRQRHAPGWSKPGDSLR